MKAWHDMTDSFIAEPRRLAEAIRAACLEAAADAYEDAGLQGLCAEGRWERALDGIRELDLAALAPTEAAAELPELISERLVLCVPAAADAERCARYAADNRSHLAPWEPERNDAYYTVEHWRAEVDRLTGAVCAGTGLSFILLDRANPGGPVLGRVTLSNIVRGPFQAANLGYSLDHLAEGRGLMHEALAALLDHAFGTLGLHRVMANYMPRNRRSARLLSRLGFVEEGLARSYLEIAGRWEDHVLTSLTSEAWQEARENGGASPHLG